MFRGGKIRLIAFVVLFLFIILKIYLNLSDFEDLQNFESRNNAFKADNGNSFEKSFETKDEGFNHNTVRMPWKHSEYEKLPQFTERIDKEDFKHSFELEKSKLEPPSHHKESKDPLQRWLKKAALRDDQKTKKDNNKNTQVKIKKTRHQAGEHIALSRKHDYKNTTLYQQKCVVPQLDPFNADVKPFIHEMLFFTGKRCPIHQSCQLNDGVLKVNLKDVQFAGYLYIRRKDDDRNVLPEIVKLTKSHTRDEGKPTCVHMAESSNLLTFILGFPTFKEFNPQRNLKPIKEEFNMVLKKDIKGCSKHRQVVFKNNQILHPASGRCAIVKGDSPDSFTVVLASSTSDCDQNNRRTRFQFRSDGRIVFNDTYCLNYKAIYSFAMFRFEKCMDNSTIYFQFTDHIQDVSEEITLTEDYIEVVYMKNNEMNFEFFMYPIKTEHSKERLTNKNSIKTPAQLREESRHEDELDVIMLMIDSISRGSAQRYMNKTYTMLQNDPNSVIMKGHTINGDGTTAQILAMLIGQLEHELPEARRSFPNATYVDEWPFIFKKYEKDRGYTTLLSEDYPNMSIFNYRLKGFDKQPTSKYLRTWWKAANEMIEKANKVTTRCNHEFAYQYLKDFLKVYRREKKFMFNVANVAHNYPQKSVMVDNDLYQLYKEMNQTGQLNHSLVFVFGDHGDRASEFRRTLHGKLEERLPLMSLTLPTWFKQKHSKLFSNLQSNSKVLTTHYDIYATLNHVLNQFKMAPTHKYGRSLFTGITPLNRTCAQAGIDSHWCPCLTYTKLDTNDPMVRKVAIKSVRYINKLVSKDEKPRRSCVQLKLLKIERAAEQVVNKDVVEFTQTKENSQCDECGVVKDKGFKFHKKLLEIVLTVSPSNGQYEISVACNIKTGKITTGSISRINLYGKQPECIAREYPYLRKYCYCK